MPISGKPEIGWRGSPFPCCSASAVLLALLTALLATLTGAIRLLLLLLAGLLLPAALMLATLLLAALLLLSRTLIGILILVHSLSFQRWLLEAPRPNPRQRVGADCVPRVAGR